MFKKIKKYQQFLESIKTEENKAVLEAVTEAFKACMESEFQLQDSEKITDPMTKGYITAMFWAEGNEEVGDKGIYDISEQTWKDIAADIAKFKELANPLLADQQEYSEEQAGHDLWLTRNHHGAGFWDRNELDEEVGKQLTKIAQDMGEKNLMLGDDGKLFLA
jgi:hypothetical protein